MATSNETAVAAWRLLKELGCVRADFEEEAIEAMRTVLDIHEEHLRLQEIVKRMKVLKGRWLL